MSTLYPLKFKPIFKDKIWGGDKIKTLLGKNFSPLSNCGECWEISTFNDDLSIITNGPLSGNELQEIIEVYMGDLVGDIVYEKFGNFFPLLVKFIDTNDYLSIQVHPSDELAKERHQSYGKTEMWYIIDAEKDAEILLGLNKDISRGEFLEYIYLEKSKKIKEIFNIEKPQKGDVFFVRPGTLHSIGKGICLVEIQQASDITYRVYDWDRVDEKGIPRPLHTNYAIDAINYKKYEDYKKIYKEKQNEKVQLASCDYFTTNLIFFLRPITLNYSLLNSFVLHICIEGEYFLQYDSQNNSMPEKEMLVKKGETILIPAIFNEITLSPEIPSKILEVYIM